VPSIIKNAMRRLQNGRAVGKKKNGGLCMTFFFPALQNA